MPKAHRILTLMVAMFALGGVFTADGALATCPEPFCDSVQYSDCMVICPSGDIVYSVIVKDSCGDPVCDPNLWLDFGTCPVNLCPTQTQWPEVFPDSCNPVTGEHFFSIRAGLQDCTNCPAQLYVNGTLCGNIRVRFLDNDGDLCVTPSDWFGSLACNDYDCDNVLTSIDQMIHSDHLDHCCDDQPCPAGPAFCDSTVYDPCMVICPLGDIPYIVKAKDSCGNPVCDPNLFLQFDSDCPVNLCPTQSWPEVFPDSCDAATGQHYFSIKAGLLDCTSCFAILWVDGQPCRDIAVRFLDISADLCVTDDDWLGNASCNDYDCDGAVTAADLAIHDAHFGHCCDDQPCDPGPPFCDSIQYDPCMLICPLGDIVYTVGLTDSCGNAICDPNLWIQFDQGCPVELCPPQAWPQVFPDSCDAATGKHFFSIKAGLLDCTVCSGIIYVNGQPCRDIVVHFLDVTGDLCVFPDDFIAGAFCSDYNCDGIVDANDAAIHNAHLDHCCDNQPCDPGPPFCDSVMTDPCLVVCPLGDITHSVFVKDSCGNPICDVTSTWLDFSNCPTVPCPNDSTWPLVFPDSCDPATGEHFFNPAAGAQDCLTCGVVLYVNGQPCRTLLGTFLDINGDLCVLDDDWIGSAGCNDYNCDGAADGLDQAFQATHFNHCCQQPGEICGHKWNDLDCDGVWDTGEPALAGWTINLYNGVTFVGSTVTDASGQYCFTGLTAGNYRVTETVPAGWVQTYPVTVWHDVPLASGQQELGVNFGNIIDTCTADWATYFQLDGTADNFVGAEPATPAPEVLVTLTCPLGSTNYFDSTLSNQCFGHTFRFWDPECCALGGELCMRVRASGVIPNTDGLTFAEDSGLVWGISMNNLQAIATSGADSIWSSGDTMQICLDLENLPPNGLGITNVVSMLQDGDFSVRFQDDTEVDWLELRVELCCDCCKLRGDINGDGVGPDIADLVFLATYMFQNGPPPPCFAEADINGDGVGPDIADLVYLVNYMFGSGPPPVPCP